jgi:hypothetical protein
MTSTTGIIDHCDIFGEEGMPQNFDHRALERNKWDILGGVHSSFIAICWKDKREVQHTHLQLRGILLIFMECNVNYNTHEL